MKLVHELRKDKIVKEVADAQFLLTNKLGCYAYFASKPTSKYQGVFFYHGRTMFKVIEDIEVEGEVTELVNSFHSVTRKRGIVVEEFFMPHNLNALVYKIKNYPDHLTLNLDFRESYSSDNFGREYNIIRYEDKLMIKYNKGDLNFYLVIAAEDLSYEKVAEWKHMHYDWDKERNSDCERYVFSAVKLKGNNQFVFSFSTDRDEAIKEADYVLKNCERLKKQQEKSLFYEKRIKDKELRMAYNAAQNSLDGLVVDTRDGLGIFAGYPWFFQFWTRDEMISLKAVNKKRALKILKRQEKSLRSDGRLPNKTPSDDGVGSSDGIGWFVKRCSDFNYKPKFDKIAKLLMEYDTDKGFAVNRAHETWMDSLKRDGARIEVQALRLNLYSKAKFFDCEKELKDAVRANFWDGKTLADGFDDKTLRVNIFLAAYVYPWLLTKEEWIACFENSLPKLWNDWGGLASVDKTDPRYIDTSTGELNNSYHNGDSWFFVNNMAALLLHRLDKERFKRYIASILEASKNEILYMGMVGHHAEVSSSKRLESCGCCCQAWSNAFFIELIKELFL